MGFMGLVPSCEKCKTWHSELCTGTATRHYKLISEVLPTNITSEYRSSSTSRELTYKLSTTETNLSACPIACEDVDCDDKKRCTIMMEYL
jgi:hypothetical protein